MRKFLTILIAIFALVACDDAPKNPDNKPVIKIGAILPITGGMAKLGGPAVDGAILAIEQINKNSDNKNYYELISEDTQSDVKQSVLIYKKLVQVDKVSALVSFDSGVGHIVKPLAGQDRIIHISAAADSAVGDGQYNFVNNSDLGVAAAKLTNWFVKSDYKKIAVAGTEYAATEKVLQTLRPELKKHGIQTVAQELVAPGQTQVAQEVQKIIKSNPDVVFIYGIEPQTSIFAKGLRSAGYKGMISGIYTISYAQYPESLNGAVYLDYGSGSDEFKKMYSKKFGMEPNPAAAVMYDGINIIVRAMESETGDVAGAVAKYNGVNGKSVLKNNGLIHTDLIFVEMKNGKPEIVK